MNIVIVGYGTQGKKRYRELKGTKYKIFTVDLYDKSADFQKIENVKKKIDYAFLCVPDSEKFKLIIFLIKKNIKILVEKPLYFNSLKKYYFIARLLSKFKKSNLYVAYNHRFEPNIINLKKQLDKKVIGKIYLIEMYYGNGTSMLWKKSPWRSKEKKGVVYDLGPHLLDTYLYLFGKLPSKPIFFNKSKFENKCIDYAEFGSMEKKCLVKLTTSLIDWKNHFYINIKGSRGSLHIESLCKWSDSVFRIRKRVMPSGVPIEKKIKIKKNDPTWKKEHEYFLNKCKESNFMNDIKIKKYIDNLFDEK